MSHNMSCIVIILQKFQVFGELTLKECFILITNNLTPVFNGTDKGYAYKKLTYNQV